MSQIRGLFKILRRTPPRERITRTGVPHSRALIIAICAALWASVTDIFTGRSLSQRFIEDARKFTGSYDRELRLHGNPLGIPWCTRMAVVVEKISRF